MVLQKPIIRMAHTPGAQGDCVLHGKRGVKRLDVSDAPALLVSFYYLDGFLKNQKSYIYRDWVLDSGAFSAHQSGVDIDLVEYIEKCKELLLTDPTLTEVYALDVIGDWRASLKNTEMMWEAGVPAIPCYHAGEPEDVLRCLARDYDKIALGGIALAKTGKKVKWAGQCFARVWPKKIHGFGFGSEEAIMAFPWHSVDATNWEIGPCKFGSWKKFGKMSIRGSSHNLLSQVKWYLDLEKKARVKWAEQMRLLETTEQINIRLADITARRKRPWSK